MRFTLRSVPMVVRSLVVGLAMVATGPAHAVSSAFETYTTAPGRWAFPPNDLHLKDTGKVANITEERFNQIVDEVIQYWTPVAQAKGVQLSVDKKWKDSTVNAYASQSGKTWKVAMFGGLARRPEVTEDGFALVVCHELGHHFGGYAFISKTDWASAEGESDFFATNVCAKVIWGKDMRRNVEYIRARNIPNPVKDGCSKVWGANSAAYGWCVRASAGGHSLATLLGVLGNTPNIGFETPDRTVVSRTNTNHPKAQCRLDTYFAGALCNKKWDMNTIPAKGHPQGQNTAVAELEAMKYSCFTKDNYQQGTRPLCWFKPLN